MPELSFIRSQVKLLRVVAETRGINILSLFDHKFYSTQFLGSRKIVDNPKTGMYTGYHMNGEIESFGQIVNGHKEGSWAYSYDDGSTAKIGDYLHGRKTGLWVHLDRNGRKTGEYLYS